MALITYRDEYNVQQVSLGVIGDNNVHMLESRTLGFSKNTTAQGPAKAWLRDGVLALLKKETKGKKA